MRARVTLLASVVVLSVLVVTGFAVVAVQRQVLTDNVDEALARWTAEIARDLDAGTLGQEIAARGDEEAFAEVVAVDGSVIASTPHRVDASLDERQTEARTFTGVETSDGEYRVASIQHGSLVIHAGTPLDDVTDGIAALTRGLAVAVPLATLALAFLVWMLVGRVLRPVEAIRQEVADISGSRLDRRVPETASRDEIGRLAHTMNDMLDRLEQAADRQRRFVADASHELRTPLTRIRVELDVALAGAGGAGNGTTLLSIRDEIVELSRLVEDLLALARADGATIPAKRDLIDLDDLVLREVERLRGDRQAEIDLSAVSAAQIRGDAASLSRVIRNLLDNAIVHGAGRVVVALREDDGFAELTVADHGPGVDAAHAESLFRRFARADEARAHSDGGTGLGLAIVRELVTAHHGTVVFDLDFTDGARVVVRIPLASRES